MNRIGTDRYQYDVFISYASEDREPFVRQLAEELRNHGIRVWYDNFELQAGDSLTGKIDEGLAKSPLGIIVVSKSFLRKKWPKKEMNSLLNLHVSGKSHILPILHNITFEELQDESPLTADLLALDSSRGVDPVLKAVSKRILSTRNAQKPLIESYSAFFTVEPTRRRDHYVQTIYVNGIYKVAPGEEPVYRDIVTTSSPFGSLGFFNCVPTPSEGLKEQLERSGGKFMHFELRGEPGSSSMQISAVLKLTKKMSKDDGYIAFRLPYDTRFTSLIFNYKGLRFDPQEFCPHIDAQSTESKILSAKPRLTHWPEEHILVAQAEDLQAGSNPMVGWGRWVKEWAD